MRPETISRAVSRSGERKKIRESTSRWKVIAMWAMVLIRPRVTGSQLTPTKIAAMNPATPKASGQVRCNEPRTIHAAMLVPAAMPTGPPRGSPLLPPPLLDRHRGEAVTPCHRAKPMRAATRGEANEARPGGSPLGR